MRSRGRHRAPQPRPTLRWRARTTGRFLRLVADRVPHTTILTAAGLLTVMVGLILQGH